MIDLFNSENNIPGGKKVHLNVLGILNIFFQICRVRLNFGHFSCTFDCIGQCGQIIYVNRIRRNE